MEVEVLARVVLDKLREVEVENELPCFHGEHPPKIMALPTLALPRTTTIQMAAAILPIQRMPLWKKP